MGNTDDSTTVSQLESNNSKYVTSKFSSYEENSKIHIKSRERSQNGASGTSVLNSGNSYIPSNISQNNGNNNAFSDISSMQDE